MTKENKKIYEFSLIAVCLTLVFMTGIWLTDLGSSALAIQDATGIELMAQSLLIQVTPNTVYHLGLIISTISFLGSTSLFLYFLTSSPRSPYP